MREIPRTNVLENLAIGGCTIARVAGDQNFDSVTIRIDASATDFEVDDLNRMVSGDRTARPLTEYWTFIPSRAARTRVGETAQISPMPELRGGSRPMSPEPAPIARLR